MWTALLDQIRAAGPSGLTEPHLERILGPDVGEALYELRRDGLLRLEEGCWSAVGHWPRRGDVLVRVRQLQADGRPRLVQSIAAAVDCPPTLVRQVLREMGARPRQGRWTLATASAGHARTSAAAQAAPLVSHRQEG